MELPKVSVSGSRRIRTRSEGSTGTTTPLSILDATTANFALTSALWLFEQDHSQNKVDLLYHLGETLTEALSAYPHFAGQLKAILTTDSTSTSETASFPKYALRYGRIYAKYGYEQDPGVEFVSATSTATLEQLCPTGRTGKQPVWNTNNALLKQFIPSTLISTPLNPSMETYNAEIPPLMAIQVTVLSTGGFTIGASISHPLADITTLVAFMKTWGNISALVLSDRKEVTVSKLPFDPSLLDSKAAGDINLPDVDDTILRAAKQLPLHRYDWWNSSSDCPWGSRIPKPFQNQVITPVGSAMPWKQWDVEAPVSLRIIHLNKEQVDSLWEMANTGCTERLSKHDAVLAHLWSRIIRARRLDDTEPVHCDLVYGLRPILQLGSDFIGSPVMMINVEMDAKGVAEAKESLLQPVAAQVRETLKNMASPGKVGMHLHALAYEKSPQRIWQAFLGQRHILVTTWARAGVYSIDFGLGSVRYAEGMVPDMDGNVIIKEAPPIDKGDSSWTDHGVDVSIHLKTEDMQRLVEDEDLFPSTINRLA